MHERLSVLIAMPESGGCGAFGLRPLSTAAASRSASVQHQHEEMAAAGRPGAAHDAARTAPAGRHA